MKTRHLLKLSFLGLSQRGVRSWLTILGIVIGIASVTSLLAIGEGAKTSINQQLGGLGADILTVSPGFERGRQADFGGGGGGGAAFRTVSAVSTSANHNLTDRDVSVIRSTPGVLLASPTISGSSTAQFFNEKTSINVQGVDPISWNAITTSTLAQGRFLGPSDSGSIVVGNRLVTSTFSRPIGLNSELEIGGRRYRIVGILSDTGGFGGGSGSVIMTKQDAASLLDKTDYSSISVKAASGTNQTELSDLLNTRLLLSRSLTAKTKDFTVTSQASFLQRVNQVTGTLNAFFIGISAISLLVGALGIVNTMYTSVVERTRQIGVMKALGCTKGEILKMFVLESAIIGLVGGLAGVFLGMIISGVISGAGAGLLRTPGAVSLEPVMTLQLVLGCVLFASVIGAISGIFPARAASELEPVEALRYE
jgi:putative ABC transport system permease protein